MDIYYALKLGSLENELLPFSHPLAGKGEEVAKLAVPPSWLVNMVFP